MVEVWVFFYSSAVNVEVFKQLKQKGLFTIPPFINIEIPTPYANILMTEREIISLSKKCDEARLEKLCLIKANDQSLKEKTNALHDKK